MEKGIVRHELAASLHQQAWDAVLGVEPIKDQLVAWGAVAMSGGNIERSLTAVNRLATLQGPPGTGKTTLARSLAAPLGTVLDTTVTVIEIAGHEIMSGEHGRTQREAHRLISEVVPDLAGDAPTVLVIDEVESIAVVRGEVSLEANPVDVHRTTDAVITAVDLLADSCPQVVTLVTTNFPDLVDGALRSRSDITLTMPLPNQDAIEVILRSTLLAWGNEHHDLKRLADDPGLRRVAALLGNQGIDARQSRKFILVALTSDLAVASAPGSLTIEHMLTVAENWSTQA